MKNLYSEVKTSPEFKYAKNRTFILTYEKANNLKDNAYGFTFISGETFVERKIPDSVVHHQFPMPIMKKRQ